MNQIEALLSILLIVAAIALAFVYNDAGNGFTYIENNTASSYTIESAKLSTGYDIKGTATCDIETAFAVDSVSQNISDSLASEVNEIIEVEEEVNTKIHEK